MLATAHVSLSALTCITFTVPMAIATFARNVVGITVRPRVRAGLECRCSSRACYPFSPAWLESCSMAARHDRDSLSLRSEGKPADDEHSPRHRLCARHSPARQRLRPGAG